MVSPIITERSGMMVFPQRAFQSSLDRVITFGPFVLLMFGPLAFGAVEPWSIFVMGIGAAVLLGLWSLRQVSSDYLEIAVHPLAVPILAFAGLLLLQLALGKTAYRYATYVEFLLYSTYGTLCFVVSQTLRRTRQVRWVGMALTGYGFFVATFALFQSVSSVGKLYWWIIPRSGGWVYGPYVNHNHYAGLMEMLTPVPLVYVLSHHAHGTRKHLALVAAVIMVVTIFLCGSRGGMVAFLVQMTVFGTVLFRGRTGRKGAWTLGTILVLVVGTLAWLGGGELTKRMASIQDRSHSELSIQMREQISRDGLKMFTHRPVLGWGAGTFSEIYPQFRSFYTDVLVDRAHNDYLQLLIEDGLAGFAIMVWFVIVLYRTAAAKLSNWTRDTNGTVALAAMLGCTGILVHSLVDFNLHIPANAAMFYVWCTVAAMPSKFGNYHRREPAVSEDEPAVPIPSEVTPV